jgi:hypothetical protein
MKRLTGAMARFVIAALSMHCALASPRLIPTAHAEPRFEQVYSLAVKLYKEGHFEPALALLREAYAVRPSPRLLYNLGQTYRKLVRLSEARDCFELFLRTEPQLTSGVRAEVEQYLDELKIAEPAGVAPLVPGSCTRSEPVVAPAPPPIPAEPVPTATAEKTTPPPVLRPQRESPEAAPRCVLCRRWWLWTAVGTVVAGAVVTGVVLGTRDTSDPHYPMHAELTF